MTFKYPGGVFDVCHLLHHVSEVLLFFSTDICLKLSKKIFSFFNPFFRFNFFFICIFAIGQKEVPFTAQGV